MNEHPTHDEETGTDTTPAPTDTAASAASTEPAASPKNAYAEAAEKAARDAKKLKKRILTAIICLAVFAVVAVPLISLIDRRTAKEPPEETMAPPSSVIFATPDYDYNIMLDQEYLALDRRIYYEDRRSGLMEVLEEKNAAKYGDGLPVMVEMLNCIRMGNHDGYNNLFSPAYYETHAKEREFTMQQIYDIHVTAVLVSEGKTDSGVPYTQYEFELEYKIRQNNGTFRTDIGHDESRKQYFVLRKTGEKAALIDQIINLR